MASYIGNKNAQNLSPLQMASFAVDIFPALITGKGQQLIALVSCFHLDYLEEAGMVVACREH